MSKDDKTNVMRLLDQAGIAYQAFESSDLRKHPSILVYKTLVTLGKTGQHYVFEVAVDCELNLKQAAQAVGEKKIHMIKEKELEPLTGYVHGGCSPIGMKKDLPTIIDQSAFNHDRIAFSAGRVAFSVAMAPQDLLNLVKGRVASVQEEKNKK